jgi:hypothetical protein
MVAQYEFPGRFILRLNFSSAMAINYWINPHPISALYVRNHLLKGLQLIIHL